MSDYHVRPVLESFWTCTAQVLSSSLGRITVCLECLSFCHKKECKLFVITLFWTHSLPITGSNPVGGMDMSLLSVVCCQVEVSATGRSLAQRRPINCVVIVRDLET